MATEVGASLRPSQSRAPHQERRGASVQRRAPLCVTCASAHTRAPLLQIFVSSEQSRAPLHLTRAPLHPVLRLCDSDRCSKAYFVFGMNGKFIRMFQTGIEH